MMELKFPIDLKCHFAKVNQGLLENCKLSPVVSLTLMSSSTMTQLPMRET